MGKWEILDQFTLIRDYCKAGYRKVVLSAVGLSLLDGIRPFITTVLLGFLLDAVYEGAPFSRLLQLALTALGLEALCYCLSSILTEIHNQKHDFIYEQQNGLLNQRLLDMDYPHLEEAQTHTMLHTIRNAGTDHGLIGLVLDDWKRFIQAMTAIIAAVVIAFPLFTQVQPLREGFLNSWLASLLLFAVIVGLVYFSFRMDIRYGKRIRKAHEKRAADQRPAKALLYRCHPAIRRNPLPFPDGSKAAEFPEQEPEAAKAAQVPRRPAALRPRRPISPPGPTAHTTKGIRPKLLRARYARFFCSPFPLPLIVLGLRVPQFAVQSLFSDQLFMASPLHHPAAVKDKNILTEPAGCQPVGNIQG